MALLKSLVEKKNPLKWSFWYEVQMSELDKGGFLCAEGSV